MLYQHHNEINGNTTHTSYITCWTMHNILLVYLSQTTYEGCTLPSLHLNLEDGQLFFLTEGKGPHEWPSYCHQHFSYLELVAVLILVHPCHDLSGVIVGSE